MNNHARCPNAIVHVVTSTGQLIFISIALPLHAIPVVQSFKALRYASRTSYSLKVLSLLDHKMTLNYEFQHCKKNSKSTQCSISQLLIRYVKIFSSVREANRYFFVFKFLILIPHPLRNVPT